MGRAKRTSDILEKAEIRFAGIGAISKDLDLGNGLTLEGLKQLIEKVRESLNKYNALLSMVDEAKNLLETDEKALKEAYGQSLIGVAAKFGKNINEYEKAGGVRIEERKPRSLKPKPSVSK